MNDAGKFIMIRPVIFRLRQWYTRYRLGEPIVVVSGLPRSGTSMTMKMLEAGGIPPVTDRLRVPDEDNPRGYFELERVKNLKGEEDKAWVAETRGKAVKVISELLTALPQHHFYKVIFMNRDLDEVIASQNKMLARRGEPFDPAADQAYRRMFETHLRRVRLWLSRQPHFEVLYLAYGDVVSNPQQAAARMAAFLKRDLRTGSMVEAVDAGLYRNRKFN